MLDAAPVGMGKSEIEDEAAPEQVGIRDTTGRGMPEGMTPEGRQEGIPEGKEPVVPEGMMLAGRAIAVEAIRAAEKAKDLILSFSEWNKFKDFGTNEWTV